MPLRNLSAIHERGGLVSPAPMYDVVPTLAFVPGQIRAALPIAGKFRMSWTCWPRSATGL